MSGLEHYPDTNISTKLNLKVVAAIPCFNTEHSIAYMINRTKKYVDEIIVIDDGSNDMTASVASVNGAIVISHGENKGYGETIKSCIAYAKANNTDILVTIDGDGQHNPDEIPLLITPIIQEGADLVIGSRFIVKNDQMPPYRKFGIGVINFLWNFSSKTKVSDTQSGFRSYSKNILKELNISEKGMSSSIEILEKARRRKAKIKEVPISCLYENNNSTFNMKAFWHGFNVAFAVIIIRLKAFILNYYA